MKAKPILFASMLVFAGAAVGADRVDPKQLPPPVRTTLERAAAGEPIEEITTRQVDGRTVYEIELSRNNAPNPRLRISEDGQLLRDPKAAVAADVPVIYPEYAMPTPTIPRLQLADLPSPVRETVQREAAGREVANLQRVERNGQPAYRVSFRERGRNPELYVAEDGRALTPKEKPPGARSLFVGTRFEDTPAPVQQTIRRVGGNAEIVKIDQDRWDGKPTYAVELKDGRGTYRIRVSESGDVLENSRPSDRPSTRG